MARLDQLPEPLRSHIAGLECPTFDTIPWITGPPLRARRISPDFHSRDSLPGRPAIRHHVRRI
ncbi:MAG: hypothetical protein M1511_03440 [Deltaproteobacteria bacterium]|nr:hypothetical protein [Deltaproteobacteria bacterium]